MGIGGVPMKQKVLASILLLFTILLTSSPVFAAEQVVNANQNNLGIIDEPKSEDRTSQKYDEVRYELMTYADDSWWDIAGKTGSSVAASIKNFFWMMNVVIGNIVLMIVYHLFSLDIIETTKSAVTAIVASTAGALFFNFGLFALSIASLGIVIRAYIQQNWKAFFQLLTLILISLTLLFSIQTKKFNYIDLAHGLSTSLENQIMKINPSLTQDESFSNSAGRTSKDVAISVENKVFKALIYQPYLLLQYGTTQEATIKKENPDRITEYLKANPATKKGMEKREEIAETEYNKYGNQHIFAGNAFKQAGYIFIMILSTVVQGAVFFFIALVRIMLQFAFIMLMLLAPFMLFMSIFPSFEALVGKYIKGTFMLVVFKAITMFFVLVATSFITLGYDITDMSNNLYYRIFIQIIFSVAIIYMYMKRQFVFNMLDGANLSMSDVGAIRTGRKTMSRAKEGIRSIGKGREKIGNGMMKGKQATTSLRNKSGTAIAAVGESARNAKNKLSEKGQKAREHIGQVQRGEIPNYVNPYKNEEVATGRASGQNVGQVNVNGENVAVLPTNKKIGANNSSSQGIASGRKPSKSNNKNKPTNPNKINKSNKTESLKQSPKQNPNKQPSSNKQPSAEHVNKAKNTAKASSEIGNRNSARNPYQYQSSPKGANSEGESVSRLNRNERRIGGRMED